MTLLVVNGFISRYMSTKCLVLHCVSPIPGNRPVTFCANVYGSKSDDVNPYSFHVHSAAKSMNFPTFVTQFLMSDPWPIYSSYLCLSQKMAPQIPIIHHHSQYTLDIWGPILIIFRHPHQSKTS